MRTFKIMRVVEYSQFFSDRDSIDIVEVLKRYNRIDLIKTAAILSLRFGNWKYPDSQDVFFSSQSSKYIPEFQGYLNSYLKKIEFGRGQQIIFSTYRTGLELWRLIFSIRPEEFTSTLCEEDYEYTLFKVILVLNEKVMNYNYSFSKTVDDGNALLFLNNFITNDCNNIDYTSILSSQIFYFSQLMDFIPQNDILVKASNELFLKWGISSWKYYFGTIVLLAHYTNEYFRTGEKGVPIIDTSVLSRNDEIGCFSQALVENLSIDVNEYIHYDQEKEDNNDGENVDYRIFRAKPFVKLDNHKYVVTNNQLLCERLFNSLYFDFYPFINGKPGSIGNFDYKRDFVEKYLLKKTMLKCFDRKVYTYPSSEDNTLIEEPNEPDFYARKCSKIFLFECKAIKMNGNIRDKGDFDVMLENLYQKLVINSRRLDTNKENDKLKPIGIGQLVKHIDAIEEDNFKWDKNIPNSVCYYPILVLEDIRLLQPGFINVLNTWLPNVVGLFDKLELSDIACMPILAVSINTLYLHSDMIKQRGLDHLIAEFLKENSKQKTDGSYKLDEFADFDAFLNHFSYNKEKEMKMFIDEILQSDKY